MTTQQPQQHLRITYQQYRRIADLLILETRRVEESRAGEAPTTAEGGEEGEADKTAPSTTEQTAIRQSELVNWYLEEIAAETLHSEAELIECKLMVERILERLIKKVCFFYLSAVLSTFGGSKLGGVIIYGLICASL